MTQFIKIQSHCLFKNGSLNKPVLARFTQHIISTFVLLVGDSAYYVNSTKIKNNSTASQTYLISLQKQALFNLPSSQVSTRFQPQHYSVKI